MNLKLLQTHYLLNKNFIGVSNKNYKKNISRFKCQCQKVHKSLKFVYND